MKKLAIIGGGLSGVYAATLLETHYDVTLFEARDRLGGRIHTIDGFDVGPSWVWPHQKRILALLHTLGVETFPNYQEGVALYQTPHGVEQFTPSPSAPARRLKGGVQELINQLKAQLNRTRIDLNTPITALTHLADAVSLESQQGTYCFDEVIVTLPPRLIIERLKFDPPLSSSTHASFQAIPTWMGHSAKCVIEFETPFWKERGLSGFCFSHLGPMGEIHDACIEGRYALFGFIHAHANMETIEHDVRQQCQILFGKAAQNVRNFYCLDWRKESYTAVANDANGPKSHPNYGLHVTHFDGKIHFIGTETSFEEGGYLEGAIASVENLVKNGRVGN